MMTVVENNTVRESTIGKEDPVKMELYDVVAQFIADKLGLDVSHTKPKKVRIGGKTKQTGGYGLAFEYNDTLYTLQVTAKQTATIDDFRVVAVTQPDVVDEAGE